jgi:tRNA(Arg) A34 adenosine deaminase TadA
MCAKAVHHAGITRVYCPPEDDDAKEDGEGVKYLKRHKVEVITFEG